MSFRAEPAKKKANYYTIKEGTFRLPSTKEDPEAVARPYTNPKTKEDGIAYERSFKALFGTITDISFPTSTLKDGTVLRNIHIALGEDENGIAQVISIPVDERYTSDFLKRLPKIDLTQEVRLSPYDFDPAEGPHQRGLSVMLRGEGEDFSVKIDNNFFTKVEEKEGKKVYTNLYGFPEATEEDAQDWPFYFKKVNKFLVKYTTENVLTKFSAAPAPKIPHSKEEEDAMNDITPEDIPF